MVVLSDDSEEEDTTTAIRQKTFSSAVPIKDSDSFHVYGMTIKGLALNQNCVNEGFLGGDSMEFWFRYLRNEIWSSEESKERFVVNTYAYSSYVKHYVKKTKGGHDSVRDYSSDKRWTKGLSLFNSKWIFVPINSDKCHWSLVVLQVQKNASYVQMNATHLDSLEGRYQFHDTNTVLRNLQEYFKLCIKNVNGRCTEEDRIPEGLYISRKDARNVPQQEKGSVDCGAFVCHYMSNFKEKQFEAASIDLKNMFPNDMGSSFLRHQWRGTLKCLLFQRAEKERQDQVRTEKKNSIEVPGGAGISDVPMTCPHCEADVSDYGVNIRLEHFRCCPQKGDGKVSESIEVLSGDDMHVAELGVEGMVSSKPSGMCSVTPLVIGKKAKELIQQDLREKLKKNGFQSTVISDLLEVEERTPKEFAKSVNSVLYKHFNVSKLLPFFFQIRCYKSKRASSHKSARDGAKGFFRCAAYLSADRLTRGSMRRGVDGCSCQWKGTCQMDTNGNYVLWKLNPLNIHCCGDDDGKRGASSELWEKEKKKYVKIITPFYQSFISQEILSNKIYALHRFVNLLAAPVTKGRTFTWEDVVLMNMHQGLGDVQIMKHLNVWRVKTNQIEKKFTVGDVKRVTAKFRKEMKEISKFDSALLVDVLTNDKESYVYITTFFV